MASTQSRVGGTTCGASRPLFDHSRQLAERISLLYTRAAKHQAASELLQALRQALEAGRR